MTFARTFYPSIIAAVALVSACSDPEPEPGPTPAELSAGELVYQYFCERSVAQAFDETPNWAEEACRGAEPPDSAPADLVEMHALRPEIVAAYEGWIPPEDDERLRELIAANPWEETLASPIDRIADALNRVADDDEAALATARFRARAGYRPSGQSHDPLQVLLTYPELADLSATVLPQFASVEAEVLALEWATASYEPTDIEIGFADRSHPDLKERPVVVVARDERGLALPNGESAIGFVDSDGDGLYDVDEYDRWVDENGGVLDVPPPFASDGDGSLSVDSNGVDVFVTKDDDGTVGVALVRLVGEWANADSALLMQWLGAFRTLLGPTTEAAASYGAATYSYETFDLRESPLVNAAYAVLSALSLDDADLVLDLVRGWIEQEQPAFTSLVEVVDRFIANIPELPPGSTAPADTLDLMSRIAQTPGMLEAIADFLESDEGVRLITETGGMMRNKARVSWDPSDPNGPPIGLDAVEPVDRSIPGELGNRSQFERLLALLDAMRGVRVCSRAGSKFDLPDTDAEWPLIGGTQECQLFEIPDLREAFLRSFAGEFEVTLDPNFGSVLDLASQFQSQDAVLEASFGIDGFTRRPTPQALSRLLFWALADDSGVASCDPTVGNCNGPGVANLIDPVVDRNGEPLIEQYHGTTFVLEAPQLPAALRAWASLFASPATMGAGFTEIPAPTADPEGRCGETCWPLGEFFAVAHTNWSTPDDPVTQNVDPAMPYYATQGGLRAYEEDFATLLVDDEFAQKWRTLMEVALQETQREVDGRAATRSWFGAVFDPSRNEGLTTRQGSETVALAAGERELPATPAALLILANDEVEAALAEAPAGSSVDAFQADLRGRLLAMDTTGETPVWQDRKGRALLILALEHAAAERAAGSAGAGLDTWAGQVSDDLEAWLSSPGVATLAFLMERLLTSAAAETIAFVEYVFSSHLEWMTFEYANYRESLADQTRRIALARGWSEALVAGVRAYVAGDSSELDVSSGGLLAGIRLLERLQASDSGGFANTLLARLAESDASGRSPLDEFIRLTDLVIRAFVGENATELDVTRSLLHRLSDVMSSDTLGIDVLLERLAAPAEESD